MSNPTKDAVIRARVHSDLKNKAEDVFRQLGLSTTDAITLFYSQVALKKRIPFSLDLEEGDLDENYISVDSNAELSELLEID